jgi:hypothetical protein
LWLPFLLAAGRSLAEVVVCARGREFGLSLEQPANKVYPMGVTDREALLIASGGKTTSMSFLR